MISNLRNALFTSALALLALAVVPLAQAQAYPNKPVRIVVPYAPGGLSDVTARRIANELTTRLGQPVIVDNKPGATQIIGAEAVARAPADGYTLLFASLTSMVLNAHGFTKLPYNPTKDFAPVTLVTQTPLYLLVNGAFPAKSVKELIAAAKAKPGAYAYASLGAGSSYHIVMEMFKEASGIDLIHVPYKGSAPGLVATLSGEVQMMFDAGGVSAKYISDGRLRAVAVTGSKRNPALPDVPTLAESGISGFDLSVWFGIAAPAGTPRPIVERLALEIGQIVRSPAFKEHADKSGYEAIATTPGEFSSIIESDLAKWEKLFRAAKIKPQ
jgi:tripartite-type tricarboxylate transporter receptor subunit TctC